MDFWGTSQAAGAAAAFLLLVSRLVGKYNSAGWIFDSDALCDPLAIRIGGLRPDQTHPGPFLEGSKEGARTPFSVGVGSLENFAIFY